MKTLGIALEFNRFDGSPGELELQIKWSREDRDIEAAWLNITMAGCNRPKHLVPISVHDAWELIGQRTDAMIAKLDYLYDEAVWEAA